MKKNIIRSLSVPVLSLFLVLLFSGCSLLFNDQNSEEEDASGSQKMLFGGGSLSSDTANDINPVVFKDPATGNKYLYFASDRNGSYDIYYSQMLPSTNTNYLTNNVEVFSSPKPLSGVNTSKGDESAFFIGKFQDSNYLGIYQKDTRMMKVYHLRGAPTNVVLDSEKTDTDTNHLFPSGVRAVTWSGEALIVSYDGSNFIDVMPPHYEQKVTTLKCSVPVYWAASYTNSKGRYWLIETLTNGRKQIFGAYHSNSILYPVSLSAYSSTNNDIMPSVDIYNQKVYFASDRYGKGKFDIFRYNFDKVNTVYGNNVYGLNQFYNQDFYFYFNKEYSQNDLYSEYGAFYFNSTKGPEGTLRRNFFEISGELFTAKMYGNYVEVHEDAVYESEPKSKSVRSNYFTNLSTNSYSFSTNIQTTNYGSIYTVIKDINSGYSNSIQAETVLISNMITNVKDIYGYSSDTNTDTNTGGTNEDPSLYFQTMEQSVYEWNTAFSNVPTGYYTVDVIGKDEYGNISPDSEYGNLIEVNPFMVDPKMAGSPSDMASIINDFTEFGTGTVVDNFFFVYNEANDYIEIYYINDYDDAVYLTNTIELNIPKPEKIVVTPSPSNYSGEYNLYVACGGSEDEYGSYQNNFHWYSIEYLYGQESVPGFYLKTNFCLTNQFINDIDTLVYQKEIWDSNVSAYVYVDSEYVYLSSFSDITSNGRVMVISPSDMSSTFSPEFSSPGRIKIVTRTEVMNEVKYLSGCAVQYGDNLLEDFDADGDLDYAVSGSYSFSGTWSNRSKIIFNDGSGDFEYGNDGIIDIPVYNNVFSNNILKSANINGDIYPDLILAGHSQMFDYKVSILTNNNGTGFSEAQFFGFSNGMINGDIEVSDIDNDGWDDLVIVCYNPYNSVSNTSLVLTNDGNGTLAKSIEDFLAVWHHDIAIADLDNDGYDDLIVSGDYYNYGMDRLNLIMYPNKGGGYFETNNLYTSILNGAGAGYTNARISPKDFNQDGFIDLLVTGRTSGSRRSDIWINDGTATFGNTITLDIGFDNADHAFGDFNKDQIDDTFIMGDSGSSPYGYIFYMDIGDFDSLSVKYYSMTNSGISNSSITAGDFSGDGRDQWIWTGGNEYDYADSQYAYTTYNSIRKLYIASRDQHCIYSSSEIYNEPTYDFDMDYNYEIKYTNSNQTSGINDFFVSPEGLITVVTKDNHLMTYQYFNEIYTGSNYIYNVMMLEEDIVLPNEAVRINHSPDPHEFFYQTVDGKIYRAYYTYDETNAFQSVSYIDTGIYGNLAGFYKNAPPYQSSALLLNHGKGYAVWEVETGSSYPSPLLNGSGPINSAAADSEKLFLTKEGEGMFIYTKGSYENEDLFFPDPCARDITVGNGISVLSAGKNGIYVFDHIRYMTEGLLESYPGFPSSGGFKLQNYDGYEYDAIQSQIISDHIFTLAYEPMNSKISIFNFFVYDDATETSSDGTYEDTNYNDPYYDETNGDPYYDDSGSDPYYEEINFYTPVGKSPDDFYVDFIPAEPVESPDGYTYYPSDTYVIYITVEGKLYAMNYYNAYWDSPVLLDDGTTGEEFYSVCGDDDFIYAGGIDNTGTAFVRVFERSTNMSQSSPSINIQLEGNLSPVIDLHPTGNMSIIASTAGDEYSPGNVYIIDTSEFTSDRTSVTYTGDDLYGLPVYIGDAEKPFSASSGTEIYIGGLKSDFHIYDY